MKGRLLIGGLALVLALGLAGCGGAQPPAGQQEEPPANTCDHPYSDWISGEDTHYQICPLCGEKHDEEAHRYVNYCGLSYTLKEGAEGAIVRLSLPAGTTRYLVNTVWVYVGPSQGATLCLARGTYSSSSFYNSNDFELTGKAGWYELKLGAPIPCTVYRYFSVQAKGGDIALREIVFFGGEEGTSNEIIPATAEANAHKGLVDCPQQPDSLYACEVCGKDRP